MKGIDYSWSRPGGAAIKAAGFEFVMRYVPYFGDGGKGLTVPELADLRANGLPVGLVFESTAARHLEGFAAGMMDARTAIDGIAGLGLPSNRPIYFAVDFYAQPDQMRAIDDYQSGAASILGIERVGVYGSYAVIDHCHKAGTAAWFWQTYAWSRGLVHPERHLYQYSNGETLNESAVDYNFGYGTDQGLWPANEEDEMGMTPSERAEFDALKRAVFAGTEQPGDEGTRLAYANFKIGEGGQSVNDRAASALAIALKAHGEDVDGLDEADVQRIAAQVLSGARIVPGG